MINDLLEQQQKLGLKQLKPLSLLLYQLLLRHSLQFSILPLRSYIYIFDQLQHSHIQIQEQFHYQQHRRMIDSSILHHIQHFHMKLSNQPIVVQRKILRLYFDCNEHLLKILLLKKPNMIHIDLDFQLESLILLVPNQLHQECYWLELVSQYIFRQLCILPYQSNILQQILLMQDQQKHSFQDHKSQVLLHVFHCELQHMPNFGYKLQVQKLALIGYIFCYIQSSIVGKNGFALSLHSKIHSYRE